LIEKNVLNHFNKLLQSVHIEVVEQVIWGIGNIAGDSPTTRNRVIESGALDSISVVLNQAPPGTSFMRNASWALSNLCRGRPQPDYNLVKGAIPTLIKVLVENDKEDIITDVCWALSYLSDGAKERVNDLLQPNLLQKIIKLLEHE
jgi:importin subunit alpha-6/7